MPTYDEARKEYCAAMGEELGTAYHLIWNECAFLHTRWEEYVEMFGKSQAEFKLMNEVAPGFFKSVQDNAWEHILLHLCKFADPAKVAGRRTLSMDSLLCIPAAQVVPDIKSLVSEARAKIKFAQDWRNRYLAHADMEHLINRSARPLAHASRTDVREALLAIHAVLEAVDRHFTGSSLWFQGTGYNWGGKHLLSELKFVARVRREREERIASGVAVADDYDCAKWH